MSYSVNTTTGATATDTVSLYLNGAEVAGTSSALTDGTTSQRTIIVNVPTPTSTLNIQITSAADITFDGATLTITQIA